MGAIDAIPPVLNSKSEPPPLFDGTTRLYISLTCPFAQRAWAARNYKGLSDIQIVPIDLQDRPTWYKEKVYPPNKVPSLEHDGKVTGESLVLLEYLETNFGGPKLLPTDTVKKEAAEELLKYADTFTTAGYSTLKKPQAEVPEALAPTLDHLENALGKFNGGPFLLGEFSLVDLAYAPFFERFQIVYPIYKNYDITIGRPKLLKWIQEVQKIDAYATTISAPEGVVEAYKRFTL
ncbi:protein IN2-1 homolog B-like [Cryptomeria japonica]|uniref:protein IN2-1 homolog B-like n=1 Tax=Cryptomeria japonica TaxID=3369 RepID=UPI0027D9D0E5|nr:protein IN2-1 homolog B-like [Cryptomeria japonica]